MKPLLMIHEFTEHMLKLPLADYTLTFDDGLYGQYWYWREHLKDIPTKKYFFVSTGIICPDNGWQDDHFYSSPKAHAKARAGDFSNYVTRDQIRELAQDPWVVIGAHGHSHTPLTEFDSFADKVAHIKQDTETCLAWFENNLGFKPTAFCFPYNDDLQGVYSAMVKRYGFTELFGLGRTPVEKLLYDRGLPETLYTPDIAALS